jgi:hypothetical protein
MSYDAKSRLSPAGTDYRERSPSTRRVTIQENKGSGRLSRPGEITERKGAQRRGTRWAKLDRALTQHARIIDRGPSRYRADPAISLLRDPKQAREDDEVQGLGPVVERYDPAAARKAAKRRAKRAKRNR